MTRTHKARSPPRDIHGHFDDLLTILNISGLPSATNAYEALQATQSACDLSSVTPRPLQVFVQW
jgi:hypothetical protein